MGFFKEKLEVAFKTEPLVYLPVFANMKQLINITAKLVVTITVTKKFVVTVIVSTKLVECYKQVGLYIYQLFHACKY